MTHPWRLVGPAGRAYPAARMLARSLVLAAALLARVAKVGQTMRRSDANVSRHTRLTNCVRKCAKTAMQTMMYKV